MEIELLSHQRGTGEFMEKCLQTETFRRAQSTLRHRFTRDTRGQSLVEFALVLPILMMLFMGIVYLGRAISVYQALGRAAREGARAALANTCATCGNAPNTVAANTAIDDALTAASLDYTAATVSITSNPLDSSDPTNYQVNGVTVQVLYSVPINIPFTGLNGTTIPLSQTVTMRQEF